jgi:hypothetical protein
VLLLWLEKHLKILLHVIKGSFVDQVLLIFLFKLYAECIQCHHE